MDQQSPSTFLSGCKGWSDLYNYFSQHPIVEYIAEVRQEYAHRPENPAPNPILPMGPLLDNGESLPDEPPHDPAEASIPGRRSEDDIARYNHGFGAVRL